MIKGRRVLVVCLTATIFLGGVKCLIGAGHRLPPALSDREFWALVSDFSEPGGTFRSDNLLSNEARLQFVIPDLLRSARQGGAYVGVGPEQNFTYIAALHPAIAFIIDIRRGNLLLHLMYKALFELSTDRADFVSRLFSRPRPGGLGDRSTASDIFEAYANVDASHELYARNLHAIERHLVATHGFGLSDDDLKGVEYIYNAFFSFGPGIHYSSTEGLGRGYRPTYVDLMVATDGTGRERAYLSSEETYAFVKDLERRNLIVPVVGDFAGPKAIRSVATYLQQNDATLSAFYLSNVEQYLRLERVWGSFCANVARLPVDDASMFIRAGRGGRYPRGTALTAELAPIAAEVEGCERRP
jgi:hypothetical protein